MLSVLPFGRLFVPYAWFRFAFHVYTCETRTEAKRTPKQVRNEVGFPEEKGRNSAETHCAKRGTLNNSLRFACIAVGCLASCL